MGHRSRMLAGAVLTVMHAPALAADPAVQLQLQVRLFHSGSGTLSSDVLSAGSPVLVNVVADRDPSTATLVVVKVTLPADVALPAETPVRLKVMERSARGQVTRAMADRTQRLGAAPPGGTVHLGFWLQGTGCRPLHLQARMPGAAQVTAVVPFACGE